MVEDREMFESNKPICRGKAAIEDHFDVSFELEKLLEERGKQAELKAMRAISEMARVSYVRQQEALGLGHAVLQARDLVGNEPFAVMLSDDIIDSKTPALKQLLDVYERFDAPVLATMEVEGEAISRFGALDVEEVAAGVYRVKDMVEKPPPAQAPPLKHGTSAHPVRQLYSKRSSAYTPANIGGRAAQPHLLIGRVGARRQGRALSIIRARHASPWRRPRSIVRKGRTTLSPYSG